MITPLKITDVVVGEADQYAALAAASPQRTPFASRPWLELLSEQLPGRVYLLVCEGGDGVRAFIPVWETTRPLLGRVAEIPPLTPHWGPILVPAADAKAEKARSRDHDALDALAGELRRRYRYARVMAHPSLVDIRPFTWAGFGSAVRYTSALAPRPADAYLASLSAALRNKIKQGAARTVEERADVEPLTSLYARTFERGGVASPVDAAFLGALGRRLPKDNWTVFYLLGEDGTPAAGRLVIWGTNVVYDLVAAANDEGRGPYGAYLLWREIEECWRRGYTLDLVGVNVPAIAKFKETFGGDAAPFYILSYHKSLGTRLVARLGRGTAS